MFGKDIEYSRLDGAGFYAGRNDAQEKAAEGRAHWDASRDVAWQLKGLHSNAVIGDLCYSSFCTNFELRQSVEGQCRKCLSEGRSLLLQTELIDPDSHREGQIVLKTLFMAISHLTSSADGIFPLIRQREDYISGLCRLEMQVEPALR